MSPPESSHFSVQAVHQSRQCIDKPCGAPVQRAARIYYKIRFLAGFDAFLCIVWREATAGQELGNSKSATRAGHSVSYGKPFLV